MTDAEKAEIVLLRAALDQIHGYLRSAIGELTDTDNPIIVAHIKEADTIAVEALWVPR